MFIKNVVIVPICILLSVSMVLAIITVNIESPSRLSSLSRQRDRYKCYWDCDLVSCQIDHDDDECAYDCERICRPRNDWAHRTGANELTPKSGKAVDVESSSDSSKIDNQVNIVNGETVRLHLPRNASARNFAIWERCSTDLN